MVRYFGINHDPNIEGDTGMSFRVGKPARLRCSDFRISRGIGLIVLALTLGCTESPNVVKLTFPTGFRGGARLDVGPAPTILGDYDSANSKEIEISVPTDGIIKLRGRDPYSRWSQTEARFSDGTALPLGGPGPPGSPPPPRNVLRLWIRVGGWLFVGTEEEIDEWGLLPPSVGRVVE